MTDEPNKPIDESSDTPQDMPPHVSAGQPETVPDTAQPSKPEAMVAPEEPGLSAEAQSAVPSPAEEEVASVEVPVGDTPAVDAPVADAAPMLTATEEPTPEQPVPQTAAVDEAQPGDAATQSARSESPAPTETPEPQESTGSEVLEKKELAAEQEAVEADTLPTTEEQQPEEESKSENMDWYILKVQSNREDSIREGLQRRVAVAGLERYFGDVIVPVEKVTEFKGGKKKILKRKLYPGYLVVNMEINDDTWFLVRETPGIGDFTGAAGRPTPMLPHEVARIVTKQEEKTDAAPKLQISFKLGDRVKINEGTFESFEGEVDSIDETNGRVTVMINIFGRSTPVELEYWQVEAL